MAGWLSWLKDLLDFKRPGKVLDSYSETRMASASPAVDKSSWPNWQAGSLPHSLNLAVASLYRYQPNKYLELGDTWYRMVWDLDHNWAARNRYAGEYSLPGHFFAVSPAGALAEMQTYNVNIEDYELLCFNLSIDNLLDLTDLRTIEWFYKQHFSREYVHLALILDSFFYQQLGGDQFNDFAGHVALLDGYNGIVFFSARTIKSHWPRPGSLLEGSLPGGLALDLRLMDYEAMRGDNECINVVIFFGHNVVRATHSISFKDQEMKNDLFSASNAEIDRVFAQDPKKPHNTDLTYENLRSRVERTIWFNTPRIGTATRDTKRLPGDN